MFFAIIVFISLILQCIAVYFSFRLITLTGHTRAWLLLSLGVATMATRRLITLATLFTTPASHSVMDYSFEIIGALGSAMMVIGVVSIKPVFTLIKKSEEDQRILATSLKDALDHVKILKEMLPICAHCKKVRDDDGYWQQIETYITKNSDTQFSHGICPDCVRKFYPEFSEAILKKAGN